jgi:hypothetical protein
MWQLIEILERRGIAKETKVVNSLCHACKQRHRRGWHYHLRTGDSFYLCIPTGKAVLEYQSTEAKPSGRYAVVDWIDLINHLI